MNPAITAALIAASRQEEVKEKVEARLKKAGANGPTRAISLDLGDKEQALADQAVASGSVKQTSDGRYYLDEVAIANRNESQGYLVLVILFIALSVIASGVALVSAFQD